MMIRLKRTFSAIAVQKQTQNNSSNTSVLKPRITFYRRELPPKLISFTSESGKQIFRESLSLGYAENYFPLVGNFTTQSEPAYCGLGSLAMILNALEIDPGRQWKGAWRWYTDDNLECCAADVSKVKEKGITFREFTCLAKCNGLIVQSKRGDSVSRDEFLNDIEQVCKSADTHMVVSFSRKTLGQTGDGHFSPVGSYHPEKKMALILDTARFKYPSYYAPVDLLYESMKPIDKETGLSRGYFILRRNEKRKHYYRPLSLCKLTKTLGVSNPRLANLFCRQLPEQIVREQPITLNQVFSIVFRAVPAQYSAFIGVNNSEEIVDLAAPEGEDPDKWQRERDMDLVKLLMEVRASNVYKVVDEAINETTVRKDGDNDSIPPVLKNISLTTRELNSVLASIFILACPREVFKTVPKRLVNDLERVLNTRDMSELLRTEVERIGDQLSSLMNDYCQCAMRLNAYRELPSIRLQKHLKYGNNGQQQQL